MSNKFEEGSSTPKVDEDLVILAIKENISNGILPHLIWKMIKKWVLQIVVKRCQCCVPVSKTKKKNRYGMR